MRFTLCSRRFGALENGSVVRILFLFGVMHYAGQLPMQIRHTIHGLIQLDRLAFRIQPQ
jgi:hypothetical protein